MLSCVKHFLKGTKHSPMKVAPASEG